MGNFYPQSLHTISIQRFQRTELPISGACIYKLIEQSDSEFGNSIELFNLLKSHPTATMPQITVSHSYRNVIRGMHCSPHHKIICCPTGRIFDVFVDLRKNSPTYLKWCGNWLDKTTHVVIPPYCAHGFFSAEENTSILYLQGGCFAPELDFSLAWNDPTINIQWPKPIEADNYIISPKDRANPKVENIELDKILDRLEHPKEAMKLYPFADFAIISPKADFALPLFEAVTKAEMRAHYCNGNGMMRDTLEGEFIALRPGKSVIEVLDVNNSELDNYLEIMNVFGCCQSRGFHLTLVLSQSEFPGKERIIPTIRKEAPNDTLIFTIGKNSKGLSFIDFLKGAKSDFIIKMATQHSTGVIDIGE